MPGSTRPIQTELDDLVHPEEIGFEEYFIWWYHLFYSEVTERLIAMGEIARPAAGNTTYVFAR